MRGVWVVGENMRLEPDEQTRKRMQRMLVPGLSVEGKLDLEQPRSLPQHRRYFARMTEVTESLPENVSRAFWMAVLDDLAQCEGIDTGIMHDVIKKIIGVSSIKFQKMDQSEASQFFRAADELLERWVARLQG